ncbi:MAG: AAA family ATPase [Gemmatimonadetes bacterium]|nr:AAA family ATPase [Gemmatimonadota bacterium]
MPPACRSRRARGHGSHDAGRDLVNDQIRQLREAVLLSPDNTPLRIALADALLGLGFSDEAVEEYREALRQRPDDPSLKLGLARAFHTDGKTGQALVVVEDLVRSRTAPAKAHVFYARLLAGMGEVDEAVRRYKRGVEEDPSAVDLQLARRLGIEATPSAAADTDPHQTAPWDPDDGDGEVVRGRVRASWEGSEDGHSTEIERPEIDFADVGGMDDLKEEVRLKVIYPLDHPEMYAAYGKGVGGGILLYGPPGCGKTHLARATAGEVDAGFMAVGIHEVLDMWIGNSERNLHALFDRARRNTPCVLFFDEVDALGASRSDMKTSAGRHLINQFLSELDGVKAENEGLLILGATNAPWHLDAAFRRPGRFDRILFVPPPDADARASILRLLLRGKPQEDLDLEALAKKTDGFSGADLKAVIDVTVEAKLREAIKKGAPSPVRTKDLMTAAKSLNPTTREWFATAKNYALYSNQGGAYDDILKYLKL